MLKLNEKIPLFRDSDNPSLIYVGPRATKKVIGTFSQIDYGIDCTEFRESLNLFYRMPSENDFKDIIKSNKSYSPYFDVLIGFSASQRNRINALIIAKEKTATFLLDHKDLYGEYTAANDDLNLINTEVTELNTKLTNLTNQYNISFGAIMLDITLSSDQKREQLNKLATEHITNQKNLNDTILKKQMLQIDARKRFDTTSVKWNPYKDQFNYLDTIEKGITTDLNVLYDLTKNQYTYGLTLLKETGSRVIGYADTSFNIYGDELSEVSQNLSNFKPPERNQWTASILPIFNVTWNPGIVNSILTPNTKDNLAFNFKQISIELPESTLQKVDSPKQIQQDSTFKNKTFGVGVFDDNYGSSAAFKSFVTMGAFCGSGKEKQVVYKYSTNTTDNKKIEENETFIDYSSPSENQAVFVQNVAIRYNYISKSEPLEGNCSIDTKVTENYFRTAGSSSKWSFYGGSETNSWDDTRERYKKTLGLSCHLKNRPVGSDPKTWNEKEIALEKALYQDMFAMYILENAKSYNLDKKEPIVNNDSPHPLDHAGSAILNLCGASSVYCAIGGVVLKTVDEMTGNRHSGSTSADTSIENKITKDFSVDGYYWANGSTNIEMKVCVDSTNCN